MSDNEVTFGDVVNESQILVDIDTLESASARKKAERDEINSQIEAFLNGGGEINIIEPNVLADPPTKPVSNYGSQPI